MHQPTVLFDINETVLNLDSLRPKFAALFGDPAFASTWFSMLLHSSTVCMSTGIRTDFAQLAEVALHSLAEQHSVPLSEEQSSELLSTFATLPAHPDVKEALSTLRQAGFRIVALSNSPRNLLAAQIKNAGLSPFFNQLISVEAAETFKPAASAYHFAAQILSIQLSELRLVACHDWDTHGALSAGLKAAFINRNNSTYHPLYKKPDIMGNSLQEVAKQIILASSNVRYISF